MAGMSIVSTFQFHSSRPEGAERYEISALVTYPAKPHPCYDLDVRRVQHVPCGRVTVEQDESQHDECKVEDSVGGGPQVLREARRVHRYPRRCTVRVRPRGLQRGPRGLLADGGRVRRIPGV